MGDIDNEEDYVIVLGTRLFDDFFRDDTLLSSLLLFVFVMASGTSTVPWPTGTGTSTGIIHSTLYCRVMFLEFCQIYLSKQKR